MKDAIIVRKVTAYLVMKGRIGEKEMKRRVELFLIILLPILGLVFLGGKIMTLTKRPEQKICLLYTSPSPRDRSVSRMPSSA